jgi:hypothetical protein
MSSENKEIFQIPGLTNAGNAMGGGMVGIGIVGLLVACLGCLTGAKKNPCFAIPYGLLTFVITIIFLVIAIISGGIASKVGQDAGFALACSGSATVGGKSVNVGNLSLKDQYTKYVDQPMCSIFCPCPAVPPTFDASNKAYSQKALANWGRYVDHANSGAIGYTTTPTSAEIQAKGLMQLQFAPTGSAIFPKTYNTYTECFNEVLSKSGKQSSDGKAAADEDATKKKLTAFIKGNGLEILKNFEKKYDCAGFCEKPLFFATRPYTERPKSECIKPIFASFGKIAGLVSIVAVISFLANFCGFCGSFSLCAAMKGNDDDN